MENIENVDLSKIEPTPLFERFVAFLVIAGIVLCPLSLLVCFLVVKQYDRAVILRIGRVRSDSPVGPGIIWILPCTDSISLIDIRTQSFNLQPQEILTKDSVTVTVDAVVYARVLNPVQCLLNVEDYKYATELMAVVILRNILGRYTLTELLSERELIGITIRNEIYEATINWGVEVERVEIKNIVLPVGLQKAMAVEAEGTRIGKAMIIEAHGEIQAAKNLRDATQIMIDNPQTILLRYLQTLDTIAAANKTTVFFPFPITLPSSQ